MNQVIRVRRGTRGYLINGYFLLFFSSKQILPTRKFTYNKQVGSITPTYLCENPSLPNYSSLPVPKSTHWLKLRFPTKQDSVTLREGQRDNRTSSNLAMGGARIACQSLILTGCPSPGKEEKKEEKKGIIFKQKSYFLPIFSFFWHLFWHLFW